MLLFISFIPQTTVKTRFSARLATAHRRCPRSGPWVRACWGESSWYLHPSRPREVWAAFYCCSVAKSCPTRCDPVDCSTPGFPILHYLLEFAQTHVHWVGDAIQPSHPLSPPSPLVLNLPQHQGLFQWVSSSHQVAKVLALQLQH